MHFTKIAVAAMAMTIGQGVCAPDNVLAPRADAAIARARSDIEVLRGTVNNITNTIRKFSSPSMPLFPFVLTNVS